jgi:hypothetical protein
MPATRKSTKTATHADKRAEVVKRHKAGEPVSKIAKALGITPGKVAFLLMVQAVEDKPSLRIAFKDDDELARKVIAARKKADAHSSWGWLAARTGVDEARVKRLAATAGYEVKGSRIAAARKGK